MHFLHEQPNIKARTGLQRWHMRFSYVSYGFATLHNTEPEQQNLLQDMTRFTEISILTA